LDFGRSPPLAVQPSFGRFFSRVNAAWVNGYKPVKGRRWMKPPLTNVVVVSVTGGAQDYQIRSRMASLDGIVPSTNGMTISSTGIVNVFMSMEHQAIVWCNEFVVKVSFSSLPGLIACPSSGTVHLLYGNKSSLDR
jgi:glycosylphosphatidylinositol deacylase